MTRPRRVDAALLGLRGVDVPGIHRLAPVFEVAIADGDGDRRSERLPSADAADDLCLVLLDLHPPSSPVPMLPPGEIAVDAFAIEANAGWHACHDDGQLGAAGFAGGYEGESH